MKRLYQQTFEQVRLSDSTAEKMRSRLQAASSDKEDISVKMRTFKTFFIAAAVITALVCTAFALGDSVGTGHSIQDQRLIVPTIAAVRAKGYPVNERGETYGPHVPELDDPDLVLAEQSNGFQGYIREADEPQPHTPEEARAYMMQAPYKFKMYLQDGTTVIGIFENGEAGKE
jgi:hypothetical protein